MHTIVESSVQNTVWDGYWLEVLAFSIVFGALGGVIAVFRDFDISALMLGSKPYVKSAGRMFAALGIGALSGSGGAIAILMILIVDGKFDKAPGDKERLTLCAIGTVAGFIGFTVLNSLARGLQKRLDVQEGKVIDLERKFDEELEDQSIKSAVSLGLTTANAAAANKASDDAIKLAIQGLVPALKKRPTSRSVAIVLGRLYRWSKNLREAINVLTGTLEAKRVSGTGSDDDAAALFYNRACYYCLLAKEENSQKYRDLALVDLRESAKLDPAGVAYAHTDGDLDGIKEDTRFNQCFEGIGPRMA